jgi:hypothetical protein
MLQAPQVQPISKMRTDHLAIMRMLKNGPVFLAQRGNLAAALVSIDQWNSIATAMQRLEDAEDLVDALTVELERATGKRPTIRMSKADVQEWLAEDARIPA